MLQNLLAASLLQALPQRLITLKGEVEFEKKRERQLAQHTMCVKGLLIKKYARSQKSIVNEKDLPKAANTYQRMMIHGQYILHVIF